MSSDPVAAARGTAAGLSALAASLAAGAPPCVAVAAGTVGSTTAAGKTIAVSIVPQPSALTWTNFTLVANSRKPPFLAESVTAIRVGWATARAKGVLRIFNIRVTAAPDPSSWAVRDHDAAFARAAAGRPGFTGDWGLEHERLHYRIGVQSARDLAAGIMALPSFASGSITETELAGVRGSSQAQLDAINQAYDTDANHGLNVGQQVIWEARVTRWECANHITWPSP